MFGLLICASFIFSGIETDLLHEINKERAALGIQELSFDWELARLARYRCEEMAELDFFGHESLFYGKPDEMLNHYGIEFSAAGVNIAKGQNSPCEVINAWLSSPSHTENLLNNIYSSAGVGVALNDGTPVWVLYLKN